MSLQYLSNCTNIQHMMKTIGHLQCIQCFCITCTVMRLNIDRPVTSGSDTKLITSKKKILKKPRRLQSVHLRKTTIYIAKSSKCKCRHLWNMTSESPSVSRAETVYLVMGNLNNRHIEVSFLQPIDPYSSSMARTLTELRNNRICTQGIKRILQQINIRDDNTRPQKPKKKQKSSKSQKGKKNEGTTTGKKPQHQRDSLDNQA